MTRTHDMSRAIIARVKANLLPLSKERHDLDIALEEWAYTGECLDYEEPFETCQMCDKDSLRYHFLIENGYTGNALWVGSECITRFNVGAIAPDGTLVQGEGAARLVQADRNRLIEEARQKRVREAIVTVLEAETEPKWKEMLRSCLDHVSEKDGFTPKQMAAIAWRARMFRVRHSPRDFKVTLRRADHKELVIEMEDWKYEQLRPYLTRTQVQSMDERRGR
jgi:hypothetical protein